MVDTQQAPRPGRRRGKPTDAPLARMAPNVLTLARLPLAVAFWWAVVEPAWALAVLGLALLTDVLDGFVARRARLAMWTRGGNPGAMAAREPIGAALDPIVDKVFTASVLLALAARTDAPWPLLALVLAREPLLLLAWVVHRLGPYRDRPVSLQAEWPGKLTTGAQLAAIVALLLRSPLAAPLAWAAGALGVATALYYVRRARRAERR